MKRLLAFLLISILSTFSLSVTAQDSQPDYAGLDIVFLVDQSGSMGGDNYGFDREANDPLDLRFEAVDFAINALGEYRLSIAPDIPIQVSVINFGDEPSLVDMNRDWISIAPAANEIEWDTRREDLTQEFSSDAFRERSGDSVDNLGNTNFIAALTAANDMFEQLPEDPGAPHLRAIILLTDGAPCVPVQFDCDNRNAQVQHMQQLETLADDFFSDEQYVIQVVALDNTGSLWQTWQDEWQAVASTPDAAIRATNSQEIGVRFFDIIRDLVNTIRGTDAAVAEPLVPGDNIINLPPYLREVRISIFKSTTSPGVLQATQPDGVELDTDSPNLTVSNADRPIEIWTITNPQAGDWTFSVGSTNDRLDVFLELIPVEVNVNLSAGPYIQTEAIDLTINLVDNAGNPLSIQPPPYDLDVVATITLPDDTESQLELTNSVGSTYEGTFIGEQAGTYDIGLVATTQATDGTPYAIFSRPNIGSFDVLGLTLESDNLLQGQYLSGQSSEVDFTFTNTNGDPVLLDTIELRATLSIDGNIQALTVNPTGNPEVYTLTVPLEQVGDYVLTIEVVNTVDGNDTALTAPLSTTFSVTNSEIVVLNLIEPTETMSQQFVLDGMPPITPTDLTVIFETALQTNNQTIDLETIALEPDTLWDVTITRNDVPLTGVSTMVQQRPEIGRYEVMVEDLPVGEYDIIIQADGELESLYFLPEETTLAVQITRQINPLTYVFYVGVAIAIILPILLLVLYLRHRAKLKKHPVQGQLILRPVNSPDHEIWSENLDRAKKNRVTYKSKKLDRHDIKSITVVCKNDKDYKRKRVYVTVVMRDQKNIENRVLPPGQSVKLVEGRALFADSDPNKPVLELVKDPNNWMI